MANMKTIVELPDELLAAAKKLAADQHTTLRALIVRGLREVLAAPEGPENPPIEWVVTDGGLPPGLDLSNRESLYEWLREAE